MTISHFIVFIIGIGYLIVGIQQWVLDNKGSAIMWFGYSFSQIGLFMGLARSS